MRFLIVLTIVLPVSWHSAYAQQKTLLIAYYSKEGHTKKMAQAVLRGGKKVDDVKVHLKYISEVSTTELLAADAIIVGSPVYNANVAPEVQAFINSWPFEGQPLKDKIGAAFVTAGSASAGEELVQLSILHSMLVFGMVIAGGSEWEQAFGASSFNEESPFDNPEVQKKYLKRGEQLGERIAKLVLKMQ
ncbi:MAG: flavodoxin family protein [Bacteroidota bacterium]